MSIPKEIQKPLIFKRFPWLSTYLLVLAFLLIWAVIAYPLTPIEDQYLTLPEGESPNLILRLTEPWRHWDTRHYIKIAESWYSPGGPELTWPPVYPILIGLLGRILGGAYVFAALLISWGSLFAACVLLTKTYQDYTDKPTAERAIKYLLLFPTAFFLFAGYSESLFLVFILLSWQGAKKGAWWQAGVFGTLAAMTRLVGIYLLAAYAWMWLKAPRKQKLQIAAWLAPIPLSLFGWFMFSERFYGLSPSDAVLKFWHLHNAWPWEGVISSFKSIFSIFSFSIGQLYLYQDFLATIFFGLAIIWTIKQGWWPEAIYMLVSLTMFLSLIFDDSNIITMTARYVLVLFPGFLLLAAWGNHPWFDRLWSVISFLSMIFFSTVFFVG